MVEIQTQMQTQTHTQTQKTNTNTQDPPPSNDRGSPVGRIDSTQWWAVKEEK